MTDLFEVLEPGLLTTIQDLGRPNQRSSGVPIGGAMDRFALSAANLLVGNPEGVAALECTVKGPRLRVIETCRVVVAGDFDVRLDGAEVPAWCAFEARAGSTLSIGTKRSGARCYLAVAGGLAGERWLGSFATYLLVKKGGLGRALVAGDVLRRAAEPPPAPRGVRELSRDRRPAYGCGELAAIAGPHDARLSRDSRRALFNEEFTLTPESDRMGYRLSGPDLEVKGAEPLSFGVSAGCLQLPRGGPILLMADHQASGGYPVAGCVARTHLPVAAQLLPGESVRFREVKVDAAQREWRRLRSALDELRA